MTQQKKYICLSCLLSMCVLVWIQFHRLSTSKYGENIPIGDSGLSLNLTRMRGDLERYIHTQVIFYNRIPKCGSTTTEALVRHFAKEGRFTFPGYRRHIDGFHYNSNKRMKNFVDRFNGLKTPLFYTWHLHFIDFERFNYTNPVYINLVRDPIDRLVSWYYFIRFLKGHIRDMPDKERSRTYDNCVHGKYAECTSTKHIFIMTPFFCGHSLKCRQPTEWALQTAKANIRRYYAVVGYLGDMDRFYWVLETMFPHYFKGLGKKYALSMSEPRHGAWMVNKHRQSANSSSRAIMMESNELKIEYMLYQFIKNYFNTTVNGILSAPGS